MRARERGIARGGFDFKAGLRFEARRAEYAQGVFLETFASIAYGSNRVGFDIARAAERVEDAARRVVGDGVHGEVAPCEVELDVIDEFHVVGVPRVGIRALDAVRGYLDGFPAYNGGNGAVLRSRFVYGVSLIEQNLLGSPPWGIRRYVGVMGRASHEFVAYPAAYNPRLAIAFFKGANCYCRRGVGYYVDSSIHGESIVEKCWLTSVFCDVTRIFCKARKRRLILSSIFFFEWPIWRFCRYFAGAFSPIESLSVPRIARRSPRKTIQALRMIDGAFAT